MSGEGSSELRIVLLGMTGAGKSATGNTILQSDCFESKYCMQSVTSTCKNVKTEVFGRTLSVTDTPGLFDNSLSNEKLKAELEKCVKMSAPGPHVFLLVIRLDVRFTQEQKDTVKWIQKNFGENAKCYIMILFTHADILEGSLDDYIREDADLRVFTESYPYYCFNNKNKNLDQVEKLLLKIEQMVASNKGKHYTNEMYAKIQRNIKMKKAAKIGGMVLGAGLVIAATGGASLGIVAAVGAGAAAVGAGAAAVGAGAAAAGAAGGAAAVGTGAAVGGVAAAGAGAAGLAVGGAAAAGAGAAGVAVGGAAAAGAGAAGVAVGGAAAAGAGAAGAAVGATAVAGAVALGATAVAMGAAAADDDEDQQMMMKKTQ